MDRYEHPFTRHNRFCSAGHPPTPTRSVGISMVASPLGPIRFFTSGPTTGVATRGPMLTPLVGGSYADPAANPFKLSIKFMLCPWGPKVRILNYRDNGILHAYEGSQQQPIVSTVDESHP